jgi:hypothetical protein
LQITKRRIIVTLISLQYMLKRPHHSLILPRPLLDNFILASPHNDLSRLLLLRIRYEIDLASPDDAHLPLSRLQKKIVGSECGITAKIPRSSFNVKK